jgi:hypothetical protein
MSDQRDLQPEAGPAANRLKLPKGYRAPATAAGLLSWPQIDERLESASSYWLATTRPDLRPHVTPVWGVWVDRALYFDGFPTARWARNLAANPTASVHLESAMDVVILDGRVEDFVADTDLAGRVVRAWDAKYGRLQPDPAGRGIYRFRPSTARAWSSFPDDATRWKFSL